MILATHALVGAAIGKNIQSPWLIILVSLVVHFILDTFRHGEYLDDRKDNFRNTWWKIAIDIGVFSLIIGTAIFSNNLNYQQIRNVLLGIFFSLLPDGINFFYWTLRWKFLKPLYELHGWVHISINKIPKYAPERQWTLRNATNDIIFSALAILLIFI